MKFSIITVTYNCAHTIGRTIQSVLRQTHHDVEYIIIDGASSDGTKEIIEQYSHGLAVFISEPDSGIYNAMNKALGYVTGDVVNFLNGDDYFYDPDVLCRAERYFMEQPDTDILVGKDALGIFDSCHDPSNDRFCKAHFPHQATFSRTGMFKQFGGYDESYRICADHDWMLSALYHGVRVRYVDDVFAYFQPGGFSVHEDLEKEIYLITEKYLRLLGKPDVISVAAKRCVESYAMKWFVDFLKSDLHIEKRQLIRRIFAGRNDLTLWGAGEMGKHLIMPLQQAGMLIREVIDMNAEQSQVEGIPIVRYQKDNVQSLILIATSNYEHEVASILEADGFKEGSDYLMLTAFRRMILSGLEKKQDLSGSLKRKTGINYSDYI